MTESSQTIVDYIPLLRRYAVALARNNDDVEELVQESLLRALARRPSWEGVTRPRAYLFSILHNLHIDRRKEALQEADHLTWMKIGATDAPHRLTDPVTAFDLTRALGRIPKAQRTAIELIGVQGRSYREAASILGVPPGTVMSRLSRGRDALRRVLSGRGG
jgi:RNA polymerase sigma-70 factor (ECF subfamily)